MPEEIPMSPDDLKRIKDAINNQQEIPGNHKTPGQVVEDETPLPIPIPDKNEEDK